MYFSKKMLLPWDKSLRRKNRSKLMFYRKIDQLMTQTLLSPSPASAADFWASNLSTAVCDTSPISVWPLSVSLESFSPSKVFMNVVGSKKTSILPILRASGSTVTLPMPNMLTTGPRPTLAPWRPQNLPQCLQVKTTCGGPLRTFRSSQGKPSLKAPRKMR